MKVFTRSMLKEMEEKCKTCVPDGALSKTFIIKYKNGHMLKFSSHKELILYLKTAKFLNIFIYVTGLYTTEFVRNGITTSSLHGYERRLYSYNY